MNSIDRALKQIEAIENTTIETMHNLYAVGYNPVADAKAARLKLLREIISRRQQINPKAFRK